MQLCAHLRDFLMKKRQKINHINADKRTHIHRPTYLAGNVVKQVVNGKQLTAFNEQKIQTNNERKWKN